MPRKMAGIEMMTMDASIVAIVTDRVVFDRAIHLYRPPSSTPPSSMPSSAALRSAAPEPPAAVPPAAVPLSTGRPAACRRSEIPRTVTQLIPRQLLDGNYLLDGSYRTASRIRYVHHQVRGWGRRRV